jgi:hypothetical protein
MSDVIFVYDILNDNVMVPRSIGSMPGLQLLSW